MSLHQWTKRILAAAAIGVVSQAASAQLLDPSFENVCTWTPFEGWTPLGGNQYLNEQFARTGLRAAVMWGDFYPGATPTNPNGQNNVGYQQIVNLPGGVEGQTITGSAWVLNQSGDPLGFNCYAFVVVDFLAGDTVVGSAYNSDQFGNGTNVYDQYVQMSASGAIPAGATRARISVILQQQLDFTDPMNPVYRGGSVRYDDASLTIGSGSNLLVNASFENICPRVFFDWQGWNGVDHYSQVEVRTGQYSDKVYGPFFYPGNSGGLWQDLPATPGSQWQGSVYYLSRVDDQISADIDARIRLEFLDNVNTSLAPVDAFQSVDIAQGPATPSTWTRVTTPLAVAPPNTVKVRVVIVHTLPNYNGGAIYYDDAALVQVTGSCCVGSECTLSNATACTGTFNSGGSCSPNPCVATTGACCAGTTCSVTSSAACTGANTSYKGDGTVCNAAGNDTTPCCKADYNQSGGVTVQDIFDFLAGYFTQDPRADINSSGGITVQDIFDFLSAYFSGC